MRIEYSRNGTLFYEIENHRSVLSKGASSEKVSDSPDVVGLLFAALQPIEAEGGYTWLSFDPSTCTIQAGSDKITPDTDLSEFPEEVKVFAETVYGFDPNAEGEGRYAEMWRLMNMEDEPDTSITRTVDVYDAEGKTVVDQVEVPEMEEVDEEAVIEVEGQLRKVTRMIKRQKVRKGEKVSESDKLRLEELRAKTESTESPTR